IPDFRNYLTPQPEYNRGTYLRCRLIRSSVHNFIKLQNGKLCQIIVFGAGFDTLYWSIRDQRINFVEVDIEKVIASKIRAISCDKNNVLELDKKNYEYTPIFSVASNYHLISSDLNKFDGNQTLKDWKIDTELPTLVIMECILLYLNYQTVHQLLHALYTNFNSCIHCLFFEPLLLPSDRFSTTMIQNLYKSGLMGSNAKETYLNQGNHLQYLHEAGFSNKNVILKSLWDILNQLGQQTREKLLFLEKLDEIELMAQLFKHYCIVYGIKSNIRTEEVVENMVSEIVMAI
ncbi:MAG: Leucine carboxyl methyltransferase 1, partial [Paramarteilia canceri]